MDEILLKAIVDLGVPLFGKSLKNKGDSRSCLFQPRRLLSHPPTLRHIGQRMADIVRRECGSQTVMGVATSGIGFAASASLAGDLPMMYVRKQLERHQSNSMVAGIPPEDRRVVLVDDLLFAGESKNESIEVLQELGYEVTDIVVAIDRQIQRKADGPTLQERWGIRLHSLVNMSQVVEYMVATGTITDEQLEALREDYRAFERWDMPTFARLP